MIIEGKYTSAKIMATEYDEGVIAQIYSMLQSPAINDKVVVMPDTHVGKGSVVGFTMPIHDKVIPNVVGVDIGCGMLAAKVEKPKQSLAEIDRLIRGVVPVGFDVHNSKTMLSFAPQLVRRVGAKQGRVDRSIGTLGGGNHFIELGMHDGNYYLTIHTGSRNLGLKVAQYHQNIAIKRMGGNDALNFTMELAKLKNKYRGVELGKKINELKVKRTASKFPKELAYLDGDAMNAYLEDMYVVQGYAAMNRKKILHLICLALGLGYDVIAESTHNYIQPSDRIIRKGAIAAYPGQAVIIPINRTFGTIIGTGKGNAEWNYSAPHGAGRLMSRGEAKRTFSQQDADDLMGNVYSSHNPVDECDLVYKTPESILEAIKPAVDVEFVIKPILNIKG